MSPNLSPKEGTHMELSQVWQDSEGLSSQVLPLIPLNSQGETKIKINRKSCQIW